MQNRVEQRQYLIELFDCYSNLLSERQKTLMEMYLCDDLSVSEIAVEFNISRQAVHDAITSAKSSIQNYESELQHIKRTTDIRQQLLKAKKLLSSECKQEFEQGLLIIDSIINDNNYFVQKESDIECFQN